MELRHYIYGLLFFLVIVGIFVFLWTRNVFKSTIASLTATLGGFLIGATIPSPEVKFTSHGEKIISWLNLQAEYITFTSAPTPVVITLASIATIALCTFGLFLHLENKDERKYANK